MGRGYDGAGWGRHEGSDWRQGRRRGDVRCDTRVAGWRAEGERRRSLVEVRAMGGKAEALAAESGRAEERMRRGVEVAWVCWATR